MADCNEVGTRPRIVILEGVYVDLDREPWRIAARLFDVRLMIVVERKVAREELVKRHVSRGLCEDAVKTSERVATINELNS